jgi:tRNA pseudouridine38/39 synthase
MTNDYSSWSKVELISRIYELEASTRDISEEDDVSPSLGDSERRANQKRCRSSELKAFNIDSYYQRHVAFKLAYIGWRYHGFATQENVDETIEKHLFRALLTARLINDRMSANYTRCGRTDKGVSAFSQVIALRVRSNVGSGLGVEIENCAKRISKSHRHELPYLRILNRLLPDDIRILAWAPVHSTFDARFCCLYRCYKYYFPGHDLDISSMRTACRKFVGEHDFRNFCKPDSSKIVANFVRKILYAEIHSAQHPG